MLVLSRKTDQEILIDGNIKVTVLKIKGNVVRIGIEAPAEVSIKRGELVAQAIESPAADAAEDVEATFSFCNDSKAGKVSDGAVSFQVLPSRTEESLTGADSGNLEYDIQAQFPETLQRGFCCDAISSNQKPA